VGGGGISTDLVHFLKIVIFDTQHFQAVTGLMYTEWECPALENSENLEAEE